MTKIEELKKLILEINWEEIDFEESEEIEQLVKFMQAKKSENFWKENAKNCLEKITEKKDKETNE